MCQPNPAGLHKQLEPSWVIEHAKTHAAGSKSAGSAAEVSDMGNCNNMGRCHQTRSGYNTFVLQPTSMGPSGIEWPVVKHQFQQTSKNSTERNPVDVVT